jgi:hypothetical protein
MSCRGHCNQGRKACPSPAACRAPFDEGNKLLSTLAVLLVWLAFFLACWFITREQTMGGAAQERGAHIHQGGSSAPL